MHDAQLRLRKFLAQFLDQRQRRLVRVAHAEQHFIFWMVEQAMAAKSSIHVGIEPLERPEDADWRSEAGFAGVGYFAPEAFGCENAHRKISRASHGQQIAQHGNGSEHGVHGELFRLAEAQCPLRHRRGWPSLIVNCHYERPGFGREESAFRPARKCCTQTKGIAYNTATWLTTPALIDLRHCASSFARDVPSGGPAV